MTFADAVAAIRARLGDPFEGAPVALPNVNFEPGDGPWLYLEVLGAAGEASRHGSVGKRFVTDLGTIMAHVFVPAGTGTDVAYTLAGQVADALRLATFDGIDTEAATIGGGESGDDNGNWFRVSVSIPFALHYTA
ncbi:phage tail terminator-like protein [Arenibaculum pallidiluteum]|uniref:phage tail terminator-like protein n=1 Tax=Arenibaculum pallidiluteum TaxID=2812559 RepID=UPI001A977E8B|nr:phage tail terminator-like protein [Arenibaculum pallidiluteum]